MNIWLDLGIAALIILFGYSGYRRGIVYMAINVVGTIVAIIASSFIASALARLVYNLAFKENIVNGLTEATAGISTSDSMKAAEETLKAVSNFTLNVFNLLGINQTSLADTIHHSVLGIPATVEEMIRPHAIKMISSVMTMVVYLILMVVVAFLARNFSKGINKTLLAGPNRLLGALVGVVEAVFISMLIVLIVYFVMMFVSPENCSAMRESVNHTIFYRLIEKISLPSLITSWISSF